MNTARSIRSDEHNRCVHMRYGPIPLPDPAPDPIWSAQVGRLRVDVEPTTDHDAATVRVAGELDVATAELIGDALEVVTGTGRLRHVRLDLSAVSFCDCAGLSAIVAGDAMLAAAGGRLTLIDPSAPVHRLLTLTGMDGFLGRPAQG